MTFIPFNINNYVRVRLTDLGRRIHREYMEDIMSRLPATGMKYTPPKEDGDGWSKWQLWDLMSIFGEHCGLCKDQPFQTEIEIQHDP